jgi:hypothetical protein
LSDEREVSRLEVRGELWWKVAGPRALKAAEADQVMFELDCIEGLRCR